MKKMNEVVLERLTRVVEEDFIGQNKDNLRLICKYLKVSSLCTTCYNIKVDGDACSGECSTCWKKAFYEFFQGDRNKEQEELYNLIIEDLKESFSKKLNYISTNNGIEMEEFAYIFDLCPHQFDTSFEVDKESCCLSDENKCHQCLINYVLFQESRKEDFQIY